MSCLVIAIGTFLATHIVLAENPVRAVLVRALGERPFAWSYGAIAVLQLIWIGRAVEAAPVVRYWEPPDWTALIPLLVMPLALLLLVCGFTQNNPTATLAAGRLARREVTGILAITRHPVMWGLGLWSLAHLAVVAEIAEALRHAAFAALALLLLPRIEAKQRAKWGEAAWADFAARSSNVPFVAMAQGRARLRWRQIGWRRLALTAALYVSILLWLHPRIAGVPAW
ncbi:MAG TPA: NnrU family protein [Dongiaceae bacterium]|nr:NnrU family protein [Dongiaceae bacterium]